VLSNVCFIYFLKLFFFGETWKTSCLQNFEKKSDSKCWFAFSNEKLQNNISLLKINTFSTSSCAKFCSIQLWDSSIYHTTNIFSLYFNIFYWRIKGEPDKFFKSNSFRNYRNPRGVLNNSFKDVVDNTETYDFRLDLYFFYFFSNIYLYEFINIF